ncbi:hypothetical protein AB9K41_00835, partial [Cribrihabitans sp. XS_ASV171]
MPISLPPIPPPAFPGTPRIWLPDTLLEPFAGSDEFVGAPRILGLSNGNVLIAFTDYREGVSPPGSDVFGILLDATGAVVRPVFRLNTDFVEDNETSPRIAAVSDGGFVIAYADTAGASSIYRVELFDASGNHIASATPATSYQYRVTDIDANPDTGDIVLTGLSDTGSGSVVTVHRYDSGLVYQGQAYLESLVDPTAPKAGFRDNATAILTSGAAASVFVREGLDDSLAFHIMGGNTRGSAIKGTVAATVGNVRDDFDPSIAALAGGGFVIVWREDEPNSLGPNIRFAIYNGTGTQSFPVRTAADTSASYFDPHVVGLEDGGFFIAFGTASGYRGTRYDAAGFVVGSGFRPLTGETAFRLDLSTTSDGRILLTQSEFESVGDSEHYSIWDPRDEIIFADPGDGQITGRRDLATTIIGSTEGERIWGDDGDDILRGNLGDDVISTGDGRDRVEFLSLLAGKDTVTDFVPGQDDLEFRSYAAPVTLSVDQGNTVVSRGGTAITLDGVSPRNIGYRDILYRMGEVGTAQVSHLGTTIS